MYTAVTLPAAASDVLWTRTQVNTVATVFTSRGMQHTEGGWPKEVDPTEAEHVIRYRRKARSDHAMSNTYHVTGLSARVRRHMTDVLLCTHRRLHF